MKWSSWTLWLFNREMIAGAMFGPMIIIGFYNLMPDLWADQESLAVPLTCFIIGVPMWVTFARLAHDEAEKAEVEKESLRNSVRWYNAYRNALLAALDKATRERAEPAADSSEEVLHAEAKASITTRLSLPCRSTRESLRRAAHELRADWSGQERGGEAE